MEHSASWAVKPGIIYVKITEKRDADAKLHTSRS